MVGRLTRTCAVSGWIRNAGGASGRRRKSSTVNAGSASCGQDQPVTNRHAPHGAGAATRSRRHRGGTGAWPSQVGIWIAPAWVAQSPLAAVDRSADATPQRSARRYSVKRAAGSVAEACQARSAAAASRAVTVTVSSTASPLKSVPAADTGTSATNRAPTPSATTRTARMSAGLRVVEPTHDPVLGLVDDGKVHLVRLDLREVLDHLAGAVDRRRGCLGEFHVDRPPPSGVDHRGPDSRDGDEATL